jgi:hypothetical protein
VKTIPIEPVAKPGGLDTAMANSAAGNKKLRQLAALYLLALVATAAAAADQQQCTVPVDVDSCVQQIRKAIVRVPLLEPSCCKELREQLGCGCVLRDIALRAGIDTGAPFCNHGTGCQ